MNKWELRGWLSFLIATVKMNNHEITWLGIMSAVLFACVSLIAFIIYMTEDKKENDVN